MIIIEYRRFGLEVLFHYTLFSFTVDSSHIHMYVHKILIFFLRKVSLQTFVPSKDTNMFQFFCVSNSTHLILEIFRIYVNTNINGMNLGHFWIVLTSIIETYKLLSECYYLLIEKITYKLDTISISSGDTSNRTENYRKFRSCMIE